MKRALETTEMKFIKSLFGQVVFAVIVGVVLGMTAPSSPPS